MSQAKQHKNPARRITDDNIRRLLSLAGKLQMESSEEKSLNDAIDYLFSYLFDCDAQLDGLIKKKEKENEG